MPGLPIANPATARQPITTGEPVQVATTPTQRGAMHRLIMPGSPIVSRAIVHQVVTTAGSARNVIITITGISIIQALRIAGHATARRAAITLQPVPNVPNVTARIVGAERRVATKVETKVAGVKAVAAVAVKMMMIKYGSLGTAVRTPDLGV